MNRLFLFSFEHWYTPTINVGNLTVSRFKAYEGGRGARRVVFKHFLNGKTSSNSNANAGDSYYSFDMCASTLLYFIIYIIIIQKLRAATLQICCQRFSSTGGLVKIITIIAKVIITSMITIMVIIMHPMICMG